MRSSPRCWPCTVPRTLEDAFAKAEQLIADGGYGHTSSIYLNATTRQEKLADFAARMKTCRILVNTPSSQGGIGDLYNFKLAPSLTLGCGSWGGNSVSENVGVKHLLNIKTVAERRENMLWFRAPEKVYLKKGCLPVALDELKHVMGKKRVFIVTDSFLYHNGYTKAITDKLDEMGISHTTFFDVAPDPTLACAKEGAAAMTAFQPDCIIALGGGSAMDAGKIMWVMYEHPEVDFLDMAMRFMDIRKRTYTFPKMGEKAYFIAVPTSAGTGSEVTPFAVITDEDTGVKYPLADYELLPNMAIVDADMMMNMPKGLTSASRYRRPDPRPGGLRLHDGHRLHRRPGPEGHEEHLRVPAPRLHERRQRSPRPARRWPTPPPWPAWPSPTPSWACATPWPTSWAPSTTCPTAWPTPCSSTRCCASTPPRFPPRWAPSPSTTIPTPCAATRRSPSSWA